MPIIKWTPLYEPFLEMEKAMTEINSLRSAFNPAIDMYEKGNNIIVEVELAGINPKNVQINIEDSVLNIEGRGEKHREVDENNYYRKEVRSGSFHRMISLPTSVSTDKTVAKYEEGILRITMPKKEKLANKPISIKVEK